MWTWLLQELLKYLGTIRENLAERIVGIPAMLKPPPFNISFKVSTHIWMNSNVKFWYGKNTEHKLIFSAACNCKILAFSSEVVCNAFCYTIIKWVCILKRYLYLQFSLTKVIYSDAVAKYSGQLILQKMFYIVAKVPSFSTPIGVLQNKSASDLLFFF